MRASEQLLWIVGLAMDGFAASVCLGVSVPGVPQAILSAALVTALHVLLFAVGHTLGASCAGVALVAPWVGALLLAALGANMLREALVQGDEPPEAFALRRALALGFSTSVDAMATGFSFALLTVGLWTPLLLVAAVMGTLAAVGTLGGRLIGTRFRRGARLVGGALLLVMGLRRLVSLL